MWKIYCDLYLGRYGLAPKDNARNRKHLCNLIETIGEEDALELVRFYVKWNHPQAVARVHVLSFLDMRCQEIFTQMKAGITITNKSAHKTAQDQSNKDSIMNHYNQKHRRK